ncbi:GFA family protein [Roseovarius sp. EL26]|uniref:GFA family protein n=1 Tax=Roseovarius sp. EL26 TaxID=2126672 RepID=UPI000EA05A29|nr:GFA family protein [Roseovarius sp. EL26]
MEHPVVASCHCSAVKLRLRLSDGLNTARRCDCSFCRRRGAPAVSAPLNGLEVIKGVDNLTLYQWNTGTAKHYFCKICGIYTHHQRRSNPNEYGVNMANIEGVNPANYEPIPWDDGINHPSDR